MLIALFVCSEALSLLVLDAEREPYFRRKVLLDWCFRCIEQLLQFLERGMCLLARLFQFGFDCVLRLACLYKRTASNRQ